MKFILASESPRRIKLLKEFGVDDFEIIPSMSAENMNREINPVQAIKNVAKDKVIDVLKRHRFKGDYCIIGGDTALICDYQIIGKPKNANDANDILQKLCGRSHLVVTGLYVYVCENGKVRDKLCYSISTVTMRKFSQIELDAYILLGNFWDKAGCYSIEEDEYGFIQDYGGSKTNILGLPLEKLGSVFRELKITKPKRAKIAKYNKK